MKALRFYGAGDLRLDEVDPPDANRLGAKEVLLAGTACGICGTDLSEYDHGPVMTSAEPHALTGGSLPQILGHEVAGRVVGIGSEVRDIAVGDRVSVMPMTYCGECRQCQAGFHQMCVRISTVGYHTRWGGFAEQLVITEDQAAILPDGVSDAAGALVEPTAVAVTAVDAADLSAGDVVLITGGGAIGQLTALAALAAGAEKVFLTRHRPMRRGVSEIEGVEVIDPASVDVAKHLADKTGGAGVDVVFECTGRAGGLEIGMDAVKYRGTIIQLGVNSKALPLDSIKLVMKEVSIRGSICYASDAWPRIIEMIRSGELPVDEMVTAEVGLDDAVSRGFDRLGEPDNDEVKIVVTPDA